MKLHEIKPPRGAHKKKKIVGRGRASGQGKTSGRGQGGQNSRKGRGTLIGSEGGQMPLIRRLPKVGFRSKHPTIYQVVNVSRLDHFNKGTVVDIDLLKSSGLISKKSQPIKILGEGVISKSLTVYAHKFSKSAEEKIIKVGGKVAFIQNAMKREDNLSKDGKPASKAGKKG